MHIGFRRSSGRGEYELVGTHSGYTASSLEGWTLHLKWPDGIVRETGLEIEPATSGKPRLRSMWDPAFQIGRAIAAMLLLPDPRREFAKTNRGHPVAKHKGYVLTRVGFGPESEFTGMADMVTITPSFVDLENLDERESIGVLHRWKRIQAVYALADRLPHAVREQIDVHRDFLRSGDPVDIHLTSVVRALVKAMPDTVAGWDRDNDPLSALELLLGISSADGPSLPPPDELGEDETEVSIRSAHEFRLAKTRGAAGKRFSAEIRGAYANRCAFCGGTYGGIRGVRSGVDAAHILAWSKYDLDVVPNGISLCKIHHWAFDTALYVPVYEGGELRLLFTEEASKFDAETLGKLGSNGFVVPDVWLPRDKKMWPGKRYLDLLYADLAISFSA